MPARRIEAGPLLALVGAVALLVSLFLDWYAPGLSAWDVFELLDLVLAALAVGAGLTALGHLGALVGPDPRALPWCCGAALVLVLATVIDAPPAASAAATQSGLWVALAGSVLMALGALLVATRVRISFDVEARRRRVSAVDTRQRRIPIETDEHPRVGLFDQDDPDEPAPRREPEDDDEA